LVSIGCLVDFLSVCNFDIGLSWDGSFWIGDMMTILDDQVRIHDIDCPDWEGKEIEKCVCQSKDALKELADLCSDIENLTIRYNELLEKSDRQREQIAMLEQSRADIRTESERLKKFITYGDIEYQKGYEEGLKDGYSNGVGDCQG